MVQTAQGSNAKVFHQHEFIQAGFSPEDVEKVSAKQYFFRCLAVTHTHTYTHHSLSGEHAYTQSLHGRQDERILHELKEWHNNFISVQKFMDDLAVAKGRIRSIQEEVAMEM